MRTPTTGTRTRANGRKGSALANVPEGLTARQYAFARHYLANGYKAAPAYRAAYPGVTQGTSETEGSQTLRHPRVSAYIRTQLDKHWKTLHMDGDEALALVAQDARADIRQLFDEHGKLKAPHLWPDDVASSVEGYEVDKGKVKLVSKGQARRTILEVTGKVKGEASADELAEAMRQTLLKHAPPAK